MWVGRSILAVVAALLFAVPATAGAIGPATEGWYSTWYGDQYAVVLEGRHPDSAVCGQYEGVFQWGESPSSLPRQQNEFECSARVFRARILADEVWGGSTYAYRAAWRGCCDPGETRSFVAPDQTPFVEEGWASEVDGGAATFRGAIADGGALTTWRVRYGVAGGPLDKVTPTRSLSGDGGAPEDVAEPVSGLQGGTTYEFRFEATNSVGETIGPSYTLTTSSARPTVTVLEPTNVTDTGAHFRAVIDPNGRPTDYGYCYGVTFLQCWSTSGTLPGSFDPQLVEIRFSGLQPATTYRLTFYAANDLGEAPPANEVTFTTLKDPPPPSPSPSPPASQPPLEPVSPGGTVAPPGTTQPFRAASAAATPIDALAGAVSRAVTGRAIRSLLSGLRVTGVPVPGAGRVEAVLRSAGRSAVLARATTRSRRAGRTSLRLRATPAGRRWLRGRRAAKLRLTVSFAGAKGSRQTATVPVMLGR